VIFAASFLIVTTSLYSEPLSLVSKRDTVNSHHIRHYHHHIVPIDEISFLILCLEPSPMASMAITEATPIIIPSIVRKALSLFLTSARIAILNKFE